MFFFKYWLLIKHKTTARYNHSIVHVVISVYRKLTAQFSQIISYSKEYIYFISFLHDNILKIPSNLNLPNETSIDVM